MTQEVFRRYEKKYMINIEQYNALMSQMITRTGESPSHAFGGRLSADQYGKHTISNIYFDTPGFDLIRTSLSKPVYKEKIRLRSYGTPNEEDTVFIELKKKFDGVVYKRRIPMPLKDARKYLYYGITPEGSSQILQEIDYAMNLYEPKPRVYLAYERLAFFGKEDPELRVTFDMNIRARENNLDLSRGTYGIPLLEKGKLLMEIKIPGAMPVWMSRLLSELEIYPVSYSKYGTYFKEYIAAYEICEGGRICA